MSWDSFREQVKNLTEKASAKINRSADIAALQAKLSAAKRTLEEAYTELGKAAYPYLASKDEAQEDKIKLAMNAVKKARREVASLQAKLKAIKNGEPEATEKKDTSEATEEPNAPVCEEASAQSTEQNAAPKAVKKEKPSVCQDMCMDVTISSNSAECEGAITLDWNE